MKHGAVGVRVYIVILLVSRPRRRGATTAGTSHMKGGHMRILCTDDWFLPLMVYFGITDRKAKVPLLLRISCVPHFNLYAALCKMEKSGSTNLRTRSSLATISQLLPGSWRWSMDYPPTSHLLELV